MYLKATLSLLLVISIQTLYGQAYKNKLDSIDLLIIETEVEKERITLKLAKAKIFVTNKKTQEAKTISEEALKAARKISDVDLEAKAYYYLGKILKIQNYNDEALKTFHSIIEMRDEITESKIISDAYFDIGFVYMHIGMTDKAVYYLEKSNAEIPDKGNEVEKAKTVNNIGYMYELSGKYEKALIYYTEALAVFEKYNDEQAISYVYNNIGALYREIENFDKAIEYYSKSLYLKEKRGDSLAMSISYNNFGIIYQKQKKYKKALEIYEKALDITVRANDIKRTARTTNNVGKVYEILGEKDKALELYFKSLALKDSINDNHGKILSYLNIGKIYSQKNDLENATLYINKSTHLADSLSFVKELSNGYEAISEVYEKFGKPQKALDYYKKYTVINDTLLNKSKQKNISELEIKYKTEKKEEQLIFLKKDNENKEKILERNRYIIFGGVVIVVLTGFFSYLLYHRKELKAQHKRVTLEQKLLRTQMNPHFIFNSLSSIQAYVYEHDVLEAGKYIADFAKLMRLILENSRKEFILVGKEVETLKYYLKLQKVRFDHKFDYTISVSDNINLDTDLIPPMLAQPIIENAIEHGVRSIKEQGLIEVALKKTDQGFLLSVKDNGRGFIKEEDDLYKKTKSYALKIIKERLYFYGKQYRVNISSGEKPDQLPGTKVTFSIPSKKISDV